MSSRMRKPAGPQSLSLSRETFAAITAVEDLWLDAASEARLAALRASDLSPDERRAEVRRAYAGRGRRA